MIDFKTELLRTIRKTKKCADNYCHTEVKKYNMLCDKCMKKHGFRCRDKATYAIEKDPYYKFNKHIEHMKYRKSSTT